MEISINRRAFTVPAEWWNESLLTVLRESLGLAGTKFGCVQGLCGACTVLIDGQPQRSCIVAVAATLGRQIRTIEGLAQADGRSHPVQEVWLTEAVPQCGYCQAGQIMGAVALLERIAKPNQVDVETALVGHLCRCRTDQIIRRVIARAADTPR